MKKNKNKTEEGEKKAISHKMPFYSRDANPPG